ncbi:MAG: hypothetical protein GY913_10240 [Proteobacteria bacterium]|nr:hypothetical protein [Pseudomonadota bacterium]MCP4917291.1 hypothetical protein [Pseudomonadota bacterium]
MDMTLYSDWTRWCALLDSRQDHEDEAAVFVQAIRHVLGPGRHVLLELGAGAGNNAWFLSRELDCVLTDLSGDWRSAAPRTPAASTSWGT